MAFTVLRMSRIHPNDDEDLNICIISYVTLSLTKMLEINIRSVKDTFNLIIFSIIVIIACNLLTEIL